jgi:hypothetical protein
VSSCVSFSTSLEMSPGLGAVRRYASSIADPANSSGVIDGNISRATACMPSLVKDADATTSLRTWSGWRIASCRAIPAGNCSSTLISGRLPVLMRYLRQHMGAAPRWCAASSLAGLTPSLSGARKVSISCARSTSPIGTSPPISAARARRGSRCATIRDTRQQQPLEPRGAQRRAGPHGHGSAAMCPATQRRAIRGTHTRCACAHCGARAGRAP